MAFRSVRRLKADAFSVFRKWVHLPSHRRRFPPYESGELVPWKDTWDKYRCQHSWLSREYRKGVSYQTQGQRVIQEKPRFSTPKRSSLKVPATVSKDPALLFNWGRRASCFNSRGGLRRDECADEEDWDLTLNRYVSFGRNHILVLRASGLIKARSAASFKFPRRRGNATYYGTVTSRVHVARSFYLDLPQRPVGLSP